VELLVLEGAVAALTPQTLVLAVLVVFMVAEREVLALQQLQRHQAVKVLLYLLTL
jgi:hypothetical protein